MRESDKPAQEQDKTDPEERKDGGAHQFALRALIAFSRFLGERVLQAQTNAHVRKLQPADNCGDGRHQAVTFIPQIADGDWQDNKTDSRSSDSRDKAGGNGKLSPPPSPGMKVTACEPGPALKPADGPGLGLNLNR